ncbi:MAG: SDR family oxidoreductase [Prochloraceae cyanobacterium]|nr:SDR family oxidoreductase [Prochloraceae cyanobacterium]
MIKEFHIFIAGASRGVGKEIVKYLVKQNHKITALLRSSNAKLELEEMGIKTVIGDALQPDRVEKAMLTAEKITAVISTIGGKNQDGIRSDYSGNKNLIDGAKKARVDKFILISSIGSKESAVALPPEALATLKQALEAKAKAEEYLQKSGLTYTIIRPGGLKSEPATGNGILTENYQVAGMIHRADAAKLAIDCLLSDRANNKTLSAVDRNMTYSQVDFVEFNPT